MNKEEYKAIHQQLRILYRIDEYEFIKKLEELNFTFFFYRDPHIHIIQKIQDRLNKFRKIPIYIDNRMILPKLSDGFS
ncbi:MAG: hypothetical protein KC414_11985, partial [Romboutsia sp.]|nr:hypothetical protein [Romboutsia sp.]